MNRDPAESTPTQPTNSRFGPMALYAGVIASGVVAVCALFLWVGVRSRGPNDIGALGKAFALLATLVIGTASALLGAVASHFGLKVERRTGPRRRLRWLFSFHVTCLGLVVLYTLFCNLR